jgi:polar amino acid transport system permease protein
MTFNYAYALQILPQLLQATLVTFEATIGGMFLALLGGLILAVMRLSGIRLLGSFAQGIIEFVRGTPLLIQLYFLFYVLPLYGVRLNALFTGIVGLGLHYSTYTAEVYRAGIEGVPRGQWEAALALNFTRRHTWTRIVLPQAVPPILPVLGNYLIGMFKDTPLLATITVLELLGTAQADAAMTYRYFEPYTLVGLIFLALSYPSALLVRRLETRIAAQRRHAQ